MILPYSLRLLCLCFASFFILNVAVGLFVGAFSKSATSLADKKSPKIAARLLFALRLLPLVLATFFVLGLCVPSFLWLEDNPASEYVGLLCIAFALLGAASWAISLFRTAHSLFASLRHIRLCRLAGNETRMPGESSSLIVVENDAPLLALSGLLRPRLLISSSVLHALSTEELDAALSHEQAHRRSRDNAKRFLLLLAPDIFPFVRPLRSLEQNWSKFAEWAADDHAAAGNSRRALSLAAALVCVARLGNSPRLPYLSTSLLAGDRDLSARVDRLLSAIPTTRAHAKPSSVKLRTAGLLFAGAIAALLLAPAALSSVHELLELLVR